MSFNIYEIVSGLIAELSGEGLGMAEKSINSAFEKLGNALGFNTDGLEKEAANLGEKIQGIMEPPSPKPPTDSDK